ncbi:MAG: hypothetical protein PVG53_13400 [Holophagae bacterium]
MAEFDSVIPAGGTGTLTAKVHTRTSQSGSISKSVAVTTNDPVAPRIMLGVSFTVVQAVAVLPRARIYLTGIDGDRPEAELLLRREDGEPLEVTGIEGDSDRLDIETTTLESPRTIGNIEGRAGDVLLAATVGPGASASTSNGTIKVRTNHPDARSIDIMYTVRMRPIIEVRPNQLRLVLQDGNSTGRATLARIQHNRGEAFSVTGLEPSDPSLFQAQQIGEAAPQPIHSLSVRLADDVEPGSMSGRQIESLVITTDNQEMKKVVVPVLIDVRTPRVVRPGQ